MDRRLPPLNLKGGLFNWAALKTPAYAIYCISGATTFLGLYTGRSRVPFFTTSLPGLCEVVTDVGGQC